MILVNKTWVAYDAIEAILPAERGCIVRTKTGFQITTDQEAAYLINEITHYHLTMAGR